MADTILTWQDHHQDRADEYNIRHDAFCYTKIVAHHFDITGRELYVLRCKKTN
jgi:hypothetical protein